MLSGARRSADGLYRVQTTYTTSLSCAEFMSMVTPFIMHYLFVTKRFWVRVGLLALYIGVIATIVVTRSRLGIIGLGTAHLTSPHLSGLRRRPPLRSDLVGPCMKI